jgi:uncharacterized caspase-like protein
VDEAGLRQAKQRVVAALTGCVFVLGTAFPPAYAQNAGASAARVVIDHFHEKRLALVIGNSKYKKQALANPGNDAKLIAKSLKDLGFEVQLFTDLGVRDLRKATREFAQRLAKEDGVAIFYFAGHGVEINGRNYLLPVDIEPENEEEIKDDSLDLEESLMERLDKSKKRVNLIILDACRDNPFKKRSRSINRGLAQMSAPRGTLVAYATQPGNTAQDGPDGTNSVYTSNLTRQMFSEGLEVERVLKNAAYAVAAATNQQQVPWQSGQLLSDFYFKPVDPKVEQERRSGNEQARIEEALRQAEQRQKIMQAQFEERGRKLDAEREARFAEREKQLQQQLVAERQAREEAERAAKEAGTKQQQLAQTAIEQRRAREVLERDRLARERAEADRVAAEKSRVDQARAESERLAQQAAEKAKTDQAARERAERERLAQLAADKAKAEQLARERMEQQRLAQEAADKARQAADAKEKAELARVQAEQERLAREAAERERVAQKEALARRVAHDRARAEQLAQETAEAQRIAREQAQAKKIAQEQERKERQAKERDQQELAAKSAGERKRAAAAQAEAQRLVQAEAEAERVAAAQAQVEKAALALAAEKAQSEARLRDEMAAIMAARNTVATQTAVALAPAAQDDTYIVRGVKLPRDVHIAPPGADVPPACAVFSGAWGKGRWGDVRTSEIWVEEVAPDCSAKVIYAYGGVSEMNSPPSFARVSGVIRNRNLTMRWKFNGADRMVDLELDGDRLEGKWSDGNARLSAVFQRINPEPRLQPGSYANEDVVEKPGWFTKYISKTNLDQPLPQAIPAVPTISTGELQDLMKRNPRVVLIDAFYGGSHMSVANSVWISDIGTPSVGAVELWRIESGLKAVTDRDYERPIVIFERSVKKGWYGYHAVLRTLASGYTNVYWYRGGIDAWYDAGLPVAQAQALRVAAD